MHIRTPAGVFQSVCLKTRHFIRSTAPELLEKLINGSGASAEGLVLCGLVVQMTLTCRGQRGKC